MVHLVREMKEKAGNNLRNRENNSDRNKSKSQINAEYFQALEQWLNHVQSYRYSCHLLAGLPYALMAQQMSGVSAQMQNNTNFIPYMPHLNQGQMMFPFTSVRNLQNSSHQPTQQNQQQAPQQQQESHQQGTIEEGIEYTIPPFWKRLIAEFVDFILLFMMKLAITFIAIDFFDIFDIDEYNFQSQDKMDYKIALEITSKFLTLEILYKFIVCLYEGIFLTKGVPNQIGGATPGKTFMGIRVVLCSSIQQVQNRPNVVRVYPATDLGFGWSFARALLKNLMLALFLPICIPFLNNKFRRTTYDILCHSVVVEDRVPPNRNR